MQCTEELNTEVSLNSVRYGITKLMHQFTAADTSHVKQSSQSEETSVTRRAQGKQNFARYRDVE